MKSKKIIIIFSILLIIILIGGYFAIKYVKEKQGENTKSEECKKLLEKSNSKEFKQSIYDIVNDF